MLEFGAICFWFGKKHDGLEEYKQPRLGWFFDGRVRENVSFRAQLVGIRTGMGFCFSQQQKLPWGVLKGLKGLEN